MIIMAAMSPQHDAHDDAYDDALRDDTYYGRLGCDPASTVGTGAGWPGWCTMGVLRGVCVCVWGGGGWQVAPNTVEYRRLALQLHPDKQPAASAAAAAAQFRRAHEAYECLRDPAERRLYDAYLAAGLDVPYALWRARTAADPPVCPRPPGQAGTAVAGAHAHSRVGA
jgi:hypothetical protein